MVMLSRSTSTASASEPPAAANQIQTIILANLRQQDFLNGGEHHSSSLSCIRSPFSLPNLRRYPYPFSLQPVNAILSVIL